jgi:hypothetical protein
MKPEDHESAPTKTSQPTAPRTTPSTPAAPDAASRPVERLFPFVLRSRNLIVGRDTLGRSKSRLHFILITTDISENSRNEIRSAFSHYPIVEKYTSADLEKHFGLKGAKVVGFAKSGLAQSLYAELKQHRINKPLHGGQNEDQKASQDAGGPGSDARVLK